MRLHRGMRAIPSLAAALFLTVMSVGAQAQIVFHPDQSLHPGENVLMDSSSGFNVFGHTNQTNVGITFTSDENIIAPAQGQARVEAADAVGYKTVCLEITPGFAFKQLEFNVNAVDDGNITIEVFGIGPGVPVSESFTLDGAGENFFGVEALAGTAMTKVCITTDVDVIDTRQWRIGGVGPVNNIPEGSSLALLGTGLLPLASIVIKRRKAKSAK
jgi:hypothetical protein